MLPSLSSTSTVASASASVLASVPAWLRDRRNHGAAGPSLLADVGKRIVVGDAAAVASDASDASVAAVAAVDTWSTTGSVGGVDVGANGEGASGDGA